MPRAWIRNVGLVGWVASVLALAGGSSAHASDGAEVDATSLREPTDRAHLWVRGFGAVAVMPGGLIADVAAEARFPVLRVGGAINNDTFIGVGARVAGSPAHVDLAVRSTIKLIDILPVTVEGVFTHYPETPFGPVPKDQVPGQRMADRAPLYEADRDFAATALALNISPTLQLKVGKFSAFSNVATTFFRIRPEPSPEPFVFDPYRGSVVAPDDRIIEHTSAILYDPKSGAGTSIVRVGPVMRGRSILRSGDTNLTLGVAGQWRPGKKPHDPDFLLLVAPYLRDPDFPTGLPYVALVVTTAHVLPFKKIPEP